MGVSQFLSNERLFLFWGADKNRVSFQGFGHFDIFLTKKHQMAWNPPFSGISRE